MTHSVLAMNVDLCADDDQLAIPQYNHYVGKDAITTNPLTCGVFSLPPAG